MVLAGTHGYPRWMMIGDVELSWLKLCTRCVGKTKQLKSLILHHAWDNGDKDMLRWIVVLSFCVVIVEFITRSPLWHPSKMPWPVSFWCGLTLFCVILCWVTLKLCVFESCCVQIVLISNWTVFKFCYRSWNELYTELDLILSCFISWIWVVTNCFQAQNLLKFEWELNPLLFECEFKVVVNWSEFKSC